ncbi:type 1 glutamine amidotransferase domain-containing protein [Sulfurimonas sp. HSL3-7]|uniref:type 1 glutamine amidotransferase domain-containing protein n=1 Tax=Sulfonitrofixus jiaomeiensis TaxID=3131938 RepID=UPI0031F731E0
MPSRKKIAILIDDMFEDSEFIYPYYRLLEAGMDVDVVGQEKRAYRGKHGTTAKATHRIHAIESDKYDALYIPGGYAPDRLRREPAMVALVKSLFEAGKPLCAVCHGPSLLISAGVLEGKKVTAYASIKDDIENAGADYTGRSVEQDGSLITARDPQALPGMMKQFLLLLEG